MRGTVAVAPAHGAMQRLSEGLASGSTMGLQHQHAHNSADTALRLPCKHM